MNIALNIVSEKSVIFKQVTRIRGGGDFINVSRRGSFASHSCVTKVMYRGGGAF
jgi:hypothetical protein